MIMLNFIDAQDSNSVLGNGADFFYNQNHTFYHRITHTFAQYSSVLIITEEKCVLPGAASIEGNQNKKSRETAC
jgi:hypothetical protein